MARRRNRPRKIRTFNERGGELGDFTYQRADTTGGASGSWDGGTFTGPEWYVDPGNPDFLLAEVPNDTPVPIDVTGLHLNWPVDGITTWIKPTQAAYTSGRINAALETITATGAQLTETGAKVLNVAGTIATNFIPILIGLAALWLFLSSGESSRE